MNPKTFLFKWVHFQMNVWQGQEVFKWTYPTSTLTSIPTAFSPYFKKKSNSCFLKASRLLNHVQCIFL